jgi:hypothetical protein
VQVVHHEDEKAGQDDVLGRGRGGLCTGRPDLLEVHDGLLDPVLENGEVLLPEARDGSAVFRHPDVDEDELGFRSKGGPGWLLAGGGPLEGPEEKSRQEREKSGLSWRSHGGQSYWGSRKLSSVCTLKLR